MVSIALSKMGMTELIFVISGMKVNGQYYRDVLLSPQMLPAIKHVASNTFVFQQDNAPSHCARTPLNSYNKKRRTSLVLISGHKTAQTWVWWITMSGVLCSRECMNVVLTVSMSWSSASLMSGLRGLTLQRNQTFFFAHYKYQASSTWTYTMCFQVLFRRMARYMGLLRGK